MSSLTARPTRDFDHHGAAYAADPNGCVDPHATPVFWSDAHGGFWVVAGHDVVRRVATEDTVFLSAMTEPGVGGVGLPTLSPVASIPIETDSPDAERYRKVLMAELSPRSVERRAEAIRAIVTETIDEVIESGRCDLMTDVAMPIPARMIMLWLGLDDSRWVEFIRAVRTMLHSASDPQIVGPAVAQIFAWIEEAMAERARDGLREDLISILMAKLSPQEAAQYTFTLIVAGLDTTSAAIGSALLRIDADPAIRARLLAEPAALQPFAEESLRYDPPVLVMARTAGHDVELGGQQIAAGDRLLICWGSANRDRTAFTDPDTFDIDRTDNRHLSFGVGLHRCLGSNVARSTMKIALAEIVRRMPDFTLTDGVERYPDAGNVYSPRHLPATFTPGPRYATPARSASS